MTRHDDQSPHAAHATEPARANRDPLTGAPGAHPLGTGVGAAAGGMAAGAVAGSLAGPVGAAIGTAIGAVAGGLAGKGVAEKVVPTAQGAASGGYLDAAASPSQPDEAPLYVANRWARSGARGFAVRPPAPADDKP